MSRWQLVKCAETLRCGLRLDSGVRSSQNILVDDLPHLLLFETKQSAAHGLVSPGTDVSQSTLSQKNSGTSSSQN